MKSTMFAYVSPKPDGDYEIIVKRGGKTLFKGSPRFAEEIGGVLVEMAATAKGLQPARPRGRG